MEKELQSKDKEINICAKCGKELTIIGQKSAKEVLKYIQAKLYIEEHYI